MKKMSIFANTSMFLLLLIAFAAAQTVPREGNDVIWARSTAGAAMSLDGVLNESVWNSAESLKIIYGQRTGLPTSGWRAEFQPDAITDPTNATVKFLVTPDNYLWLGFDIPDSSIGGTQDWARWDAILMSIKNRASENRPTDATEFFYSWWYVNIDAQVAPGAPPRFIGRWGNFNDTTRTAGQRAAWDARTVIDGISNDDSAPDNGWTVEMRISLDSLGYDATRPEGDVIELNFSIWDGDWIFGGDPSRVSSERTSWQSPWGNANTDNVGRVRVRPDVTVNSGATPSTGPDVRVPNGINSPAPVIDGDLSDAYWANAYSFNIRWDDADVRSSYPGVGPYRSGQFQPEINGNPRPPVLDPADATIKVFFRDHFLYLGADVRDQLVQGTAVFDQIDGVKFMIAHRDSLNADNELEFLQLTATFDTDGNPTGLDALPLLQSQGAAEFQIGLKGATTVNENTDVDEGYVIEIKLDLTALGYPADLGDRLLFMGVMLADGDSFDDPLNDYGSRTWWFREWDWGPACAWMFMDPGLTAIGDKPGANLPKTIELYGNFPNPFNPATTISYAIPFSGDVNLIVYNLLGQEVARVAKTRQTAGSHIQVFDAGNLSSGIYFYQIQVENAQTGQLLKSQSNKMVLLK